MMKRWGQDENNGDGKEEDIISHHYFWAGWGI
jgi:hypothetical protein